MNHTVKTKTPVFSAENGSILIDVHIETSDKFYNHLDPFTGGLKGSGRGDTELYIKNAVEDLTAEERKHAKIVLYLRYDLYRNVTGRRSMEQAVTAKLCVTAQAGTAQV